MSATNFFIRSAGRISSPRVTTSAQRSTMRPQQQFQTRSYADSNGRPPLYQGGYNKNLILGLAAVAVPALAYYTMRDSSPHATRVTAPTLDPATKRREHEPNMHKYKHPEDDDPELNVPFGQVHKRKRVDGPPDHRNHQSLCERNKLV